MRHIWCTCAGLLGTSDLSRRKRARAENGAQRDDTSGGSVPATTRHLTTSPMMDADDYEGAIATLQEQLHAAHASHRQRHDEWLAEMRQLKDAHAKERMAAQERDAKHDLALGQKDLELQKALKAVRQLREALMFERQQSPGMRSSAASASS